MCKQTFSLKITYDIDLIINTYKALKLKEIFIDTIDKLNQLNLNTSEIVKRDNINTIKSTVGNKPVYDNMGIYLGNEVVMSFEIK
jgi:hypothetical protein